MKKNKYSKNLVHLNIYEKKLYIKTFRLCNGPNGLNITYKRIELEVLKRVS